MKMTQHSHKNGDKFHVYFYGANELAAFEAGMIILRIFMTSELKGDQAAIDQVNKLFPIVPPVYHGKKGFLNTFIFNLLQVEDGKQIGTEKYDIYAYALLFYWLEVYYNILMKPIELGEQDNSIAELLG